MLDNSQFSQNAISHKELNDFLIKAKKDTSSIDTPEHNHIKDNHEFHDLIKSWTETSHKLLLMINKEQRVISENSDSKSLMAYGAMGAYINMALHALKATDSDQ